MKPYLEIVNFFHSAAYRVPLPVTETRTFRDGDYAVCPRCRLTLPREFVRFCDRCGQCLNWDRY